MAKDMSNALGTDEIGDKGRDDNTLQAAIDAIKGEGDLSSPKGQTPTEDRVLAPTNDQEDPAIENPPKAAEPKAEKTEKK